MSCQAYLDNIEDKTGLTPRQFTRGATIRETHVGSDEAHRNDSATRWLDGKASKPV